MRESDTSHVLLLTAHHIVTDGWSMGVVLDELCTAYAALARGAAPDLPPVATQYPDFAVWQREQLSGPRLEQDLAHWKRRLAAAVAPELPLDRPRRGEEAGPGAVHGFTVPAPLTARLRELVAQQHTTLYVALVAATQALLARWSGGTGQQDVTVGSLTPGRSRTDLERAVGCFVNTVVLRTPVERSGSFRELLAATADTVNDSLAHGDTPFERLVEAVGAPREAGRNPLFDVMVLLHPAPPAATAPDGLEISPVEIPQRSATFDLSVEFVPDGDGLAGLLEYRSDLFDEATVRRMAGQLLRLLEGAAAEPDRPLGTLPLLSAREIHQVTREWNATEFPVEDTAYPELLQRRAALTPQAPALVAGEERLDYATLNARANRLAHHLIALGAGPERLVALRLPRTADLVVAILAVWKSGAGYLPLDPDLPAERLRYLLDDARPALVLDEEALRAAPATGPDTDPADARPARPAAPGEHRLRHLHLRLHRPAQGRPRFAPVGCAPAGRPPGRLRRRGGRRAAEGGADRLVLLRHLAGGRAADGRRPPAAPGGRGDPDGSGRPGRVRGPAPRRLPRRDSLLPRAVAARRAAHRSAAPAAGADARRRGGRTPPVARAHRTPATGRLQLLRPHRVHGRRAGLPHRGRRPPAGGPSAAQRPGLRPRRPAPAGAARRRGGAVPGGQAGSPAATPAAPA